MTEVNHAGESEQSVGPTAQARVDLIESTPLMPAAGIWDPVLTRPSSSVLVLRYSRRTAISAWLFRGFLLIVLPIGALGGLQAGSWFLALCNGGLGLHRRRRLLSEVGALQLVSVAGNT
jgi:hypothetical protein